MRDRKEVVLRALYRELAVLEKEAKKATSNYEQCINAASNIIAIRREVVELLKAKLDKPEVSKKLKALMKNEEECFKFGEMNLTVLMDIEHTARMELEELRNYIYSIERESSL